jgi:branched-chain amino acid transport system permease protein
MRGLMTPTRAWTVVLLAAALVAPHFVYPVFIMKALCFALFAGAFNLLVGYVGLLSFGHAAFMGSASYITAYAIQSRGYSPGLGILAGVAAAALLGTVFGWIAIRRQGIYFAMVTLALAQMIYFTALQAPFTGGEDGLQGVPRGRLFGLLDLNNSLVLYYVVLAIFLAGFGLIVRTVRSPFGQVLKAIRDNEPRAISLGYRVERYKLLAFVLSATLAGLAGATKVLVFQLASLTDVDWTMSGEVVLMVLLGGLGTLFGPVVGAFMIIAMENYLAEMGSWVTIIEGVIFVACVLTFRRGVVGTLGSYLSRGGRASAPSDPLASAPPAAAPPIDTVAGEAVTDIS